MGVGRREKEGKETSGRGSQDEPAQDKEEEWQLNEQREDVEEREENIDVEEREENIDDEEREKERERGSNLWRQLLASPTVQVLVTQTTQPVLKNRLRDEL